MAADHPPMFRRGARHRHAPAGCGAYRSPGPGTAVPAGLLARAIAILLPGAVIGALVLVTLHARREIRRLEGALRQAIRQADQDPLTGLANRRRAEQRLLQSRVGMVGLLDLDDFKQVNDRFGHQTGDQVLVTVAHRLSTATAGHALVARLAGDEFLVIWDHTPSDVLAAGHRLLRRVGEPVHLDGRTLTPRASLGLAVPGPALHGTALIAAADSAMYDAKNTSPAHHSGRPASVSLYSRAQPPAAGDRRAGPRSPDSRRR